MFTQDYLLQRLYVKGEVSNCKYHSSGHIYFTLKDSRGTISCVMFAGSRAGLSFRMSEGQQVIVGGAVDVDGVHETAGVLLPVQLRQPHRLIDRHSRGNVVIEAQLVHSQAQPLFVCPKASR